MTPPLVPSPDERARLISAYLHSAAEQLRGRSRRRAVEIADNVLRNALRSSRRSLPIRVAAPYDYVWISDRVLITLLRRDIDAALEAAAVGRIHLVVDRDQPLREITVELFVQYGQVLIDVADEARTIAHRVLSHVLTGPDEVTIQVVTSHVHVSDVTIGNPHLVDPTDEARH
ncbi:MAG: hypothetical protein ABI746_08275 [Dermatophilaceae bacterium]